MNRIEELKMKVVTTFYRRVVVVARALVGGVEVPELAISVEFRNLSESEVGAYRRLRPDQSAASVEQRLAAGHECAAVWHRGRIVHAGWSARGRAYVPYLNRDMVLGGDEVLILDTFTLPEYRRLSLAKARSIHQEAELVARGLRRLLAVVALENRAGMAAALATGNRPIGRYEYLRAGPWSRYWESPDGDDVALPPLVPSLGKVAVPYSN